MQLISELTAHLFKYIVIHFNEIWNKAAFLHQYKNGKICILLYQASDELEAAEGGAGRPWVLPNIPEAPPVEPMAPPVEPMAPPVEPAVTPASSQIEEQGTAHKRRKKQEKGFESINMESMYSQEALSRG